MMGVPTELHGETGSPEDVTTSQHEPPATGDPAHFRDSERLIKMTGQTSSTLEHQDGVLDENANVDFKVERLQLKGLTEDDDTPDKRLSTAEGQDPPVPSSDHHGITADRGDMDAPVISGHNPLSPLHGDHTQRGQEEEEEEEQEEEPPEMTAEDRKAMHEAVKAGDIDLLEDLLEKANADLNMVYFGENLLVTALRADQQEMAEFLLDNGVDPNFAATLMHMGAQGSTGKTSQKKAMEVYQYTCRQMAYDKGFLDIVEIIDILNGRLFPGVKPRQRVPRYRRPPPTPTPSSSTVTDSDASSSSSSGDESDVSGLTRSSVGGAEEDTGREPGSSRRLSTTRDQEEGHHLTVPSRDRRRKKKKKVRSEADGEEMDGEGLPSEKDSGVQEERKTKKRRKAQDLEKDSASSRTDEEGTTSRRSEASRAEAGNLTDRSKATTAKASDRTEEDGEEEEEGEAGVHDEGYETMSPSPSHPLGAHLQQQQGSRFQPPSIPVKPNKAFLVLRRTNDAHKQHCIPAKFNEARPLTWKKVRTAGSYQAESPLWHQPSAQSPKLPPPTPAGTPTTVSMLSPRSGVQSRAETSCSLVSTVELSVGNVTKPKILHPSSHRLNSGKSSVTAISSASSGLSPSSLTSTTLTSSYGGGRDRLYPLQLKVPSYMRMTTSCFVKRRLEPNFTNTYTALDFVEPSPSPPLQHGPGGLHGVVRGGADPVAVRGGRVNGEECGGGPSRKSVTAAFSGTFPSVLDMSSPASPPLSRKKGLGSGGVVLGVADNGHRRGEVVPNIRNNSSVHHTSKLTSAKIR